MSTAHLSARDVELLYLGCAPASADTHASHCEPCAAALLALRTERDALLQRSPPAAYARRLQREHQGVVSRRRWLTCVSGGLAIAAGVAALMLRGGGDPAEPLAWVDAEVARTLAARTPQLGSEDFLPKGDTTLVVVRKRDAEISLLQGALTVQPGDEIRLRFVRRSGGRTVAGVLTDAGQWSPLFDEEFSPGVHTPDAALRVTEEPGAGLIVLGTPEEVAAARAGEPAHVQRARLVWTPASTRHEDARQRRPLTEMDTRDAPAR